MPRRADILYADAITANYSGAATNYVIETPSGVLYVVFIDSQSDVSFRKSVDGGITWGATVVVFAGTTTNLSVWYDRWSGIAAGLIHCAYTESGGSDTLYRTINTESSDALSTQTTIFAGTSRAAGGHLSITRAKGGNVYCKTVIDAGAEGGFYRLPNANVPNGAWDAARTVDEAIATLDQMILVPNLTSADQQDIMAIFWDASADEVSRKLYDDSANSWGETSIAGTMVELSTATAFANFDIAVDLTNNRIVLVAWSATDAANADLRCWTITDSAITEVTNVVLNSTDDQGLAAIAIEPGGIWRVFYCGISSGGETWITALNIYMKVSTDSGSTWGPETLVNQTGAAATVRTLFTTPWNYSGRWCVAWYRDGAGSTDDLLLNVDHALPRAVSMLGV